MPIVRMPIVRMPIVPMPIIRPPTEYRSFVISFETLIERNCSLDEDEYYYLMKYTKQDAHELVKSCFDKDAKKAYARARKTLDKRFGNESVVAQKYLNKLLSWDPIPSEYPKELNKFASHLTMCLNMMDRMTDITELNSRLDIQEIVLKLPFDMRKQ